MFNRIPVLRVTGQFVQVGCLSMSFALLQLNAADLYVAANGSPAGPGTLSRPYDLKTALSGSVGRAGDTFWLRGGTYVLGHLDTKVHGEAGSPITFRAMAGERPRIDGSFTLWGSSGHLVFRDFELFRSNPQRVSSQTRVGFNPTDIEIIPGIASYVPDCSFINLVIHDQTRHGIYISQQSDGTLIYGCIIYNNGWRSPDNAEGHSLYIQGSSGTREIDDNLLFNSAGVGMHTYDNGGHPLVGVTMDGNVAFNAGALQTVRSYDDWIVGVDAPSPYADQIVFKNNMGYLPPSSAVRHVEIGRQGVNGSLTMTGNYMPLGLRMNNWTTATVTGNTFAPRTSDFAVDLQQGTNALAAVWNDNIYSTTALGAAFRTNTTVCTFLEWKTLTGFDLTATNLLSGLAGTKVFVRPNRYESGRANIIVYNWTGSDTVPVDVSSVLSVGNQYEVRNAEDFFAPPVLSGTFDGLPLRLPMNGLTVAAPLGDMLTPPPTGPAFNVFVLLPQSNSTNANTAPVISPIQSQSMAVGSLSPSLSFQVNDSETPATDLVVAAHSSNNSLLPDTGIVLSGTGSSRTITLTPTTGQTGVASVTITVSDGSLSSNTQFDLTVNPPASVVLASPVNGADYVAPANIELVASVTPNGNTIDKVQFYQGTTLLGEVSGAPYQFTWYSVAAGTYSLNAQAVDDAGNVVLSPPVMINVSTPPPSSGLSLDSTSANITAPFVVTKGTISQPGFTGVADGGRAAYGFNLSAAGDYVVSAKVNAPDTGANSFFVNIDAEPTDPLMIWDVSVTSGLSEQRISWRGNGTPDSNEFSPKVFTLAAGTHQLIVRGREGNCQLGAISIAPYGFIAPLEVTLTSPGDGASYTEPATIDLAADVNSNGNTVTKVQFFQGKTLLGEDATVPYSLSWSDVPAGTYSVSARVVYNAGSTMDTRPASVTVTTVPLERVLSVVATAGAVTAPFMATNGVVLQTSLTGVTNAGLAAYLFTVTNAGNYFVSALVDAPNVDANSFYVNVDSEPVDPTMIWDIPLTSGMEGRTVTWRGNGEPDGNRSLPQIFTLSAGQHVLIVRGREANCKLAAIAVVANSVPFASLQAASGGDMKIVWYSNVGTTYRVSHKDDWNNPWTDLSGDVTATNFTSSWIDTDTGGSNQRFYKVYVP